MNTEPHAETVLSPLVSVIVPSYNAAHYVTAAVDSVLEQTLRDFEVIVVDDGSKDDTRAVMERYAAQPRVRYVYQQNAGVSAARNHGIEISRGRYVAFLDADDVWLPEKLERQMAAMQAAGVRACHSAYYSTDDALNRLEIQRHDRTKGALEGLLFHGNVIGTPSSVLVERELIKELGGFDLELSHSADWDMWIRLARHTDFACVSEPMLLYRLHDANMSRNVGLIESDTIKALEKGLDDPGTPPELRRRRRESLGRQWMVLAGCYFQVRRYGDFLRCALRSARYDPARLGYLAGFPLRKLRRYTGTHHSPS